MERRQYADLVELFRQLGANNPEVWARSEVREDIPQLARFLAIRCLWRDAINGWETGEIERIPVVRRLIASGADRADLVQLARLAAYEAVHATLYRLTGEGCDHELGDDMPMWELVELLDDQATGRTVAALHEDIGFMDPSGRDGRDLFE